MPKMVQFGEFLKTWSLRSNSVTRQVSFNSTKIGGKCQTAEFTNLKIVARNIVKWDFFLGFSNTMEAFLHFYSVLLQTLEVWRSSGSHCTSYKSLRLTFWGCNFCFSSCIIFIRILKQEQKKFSEQTHPAALYTARKETPKKPRWIQKTGKRTH